jgi:hypothetical protein
LPCSLSHNVSRWKKNSTLDGTNAVELFTGLAKITMELRGLSSCGAVLHAAHNPCDALSHREPLLDPAMAAFSARFGITHTTPTNHLPMTRSTFKRVCNNLAHDLDMTLDTIDYRGRWNNLTRVHLDSVQTWRAHDVNSPRAHRRTP